MQTYLLWTGGIAHVLLTVLHLAFRPLLKWEKTLAPLNAENRGIMYIFNSLMIVLFAFLALLSFWQSEALLTSELGTLVLGFLGLFWLVRLVLQFVYLDFKTVPDKVLTVLFGLMVLCYLLPIWM